MNMDYKKDLLHMHKSVSTQCPLRLRSLVPAIFWVTAGMAVVDAASAQDVSYQENLGSSETATLILQNYTAGSQLSTSNFVGFSLSGAIDNESFNLANSTPDTLIGSISAVNPSSDSVALALSFTFPPPFNNLKPGVFFFSQQDNVVTDSLCPPGAGCKPGGKNAQGAKLMLPPPGSSEFQVLGTSSASAPEMDMNSLSSALTLLFGGLLVLRARFKRSF
jgi:hypothetical protein